MASTEFGTLDAQAVKRWSASLAIEAEDKMFFKKFMGRSEDSIIVRHNDLERSAGDQIRYDLVVSMDGAGVQGDSELKGYEESLTFHQDSVGIDQLRNAVEWRRMSAQRTLHDLRLAARTQLSTWFAKAYDTLMFAYLAGRTGDGPDSAAAIIAAGGGSFAGNTLTAPDAGHLEATGGTLELTDIDTVKEMAMTAHPMLRPAIVDGDPKYCLVLHPFAATNLRIDAAASGITWFQAHARIAEMAARNPIYTGALGEYNGVILYESRNVPILSGVSVDNLFLGAQAATVAFGNAYEKSSRGRMGGGSLFSWSEDIDDYDNKKGIGASSIFGVKKTTFNSTDLGVIRLTSDDVAH